MPNPTPDTSELSDLIRQGIFDYNMDTTVAGKDPVVAMDDAIKYFTYLINHRLAEQTLKTELSDYATFKWLLQDALKPEADTRKLSRVYALLELVNKDYNQLKQGNK